MAKIWLSQKYNSINVNDDYDFEKATENKIMVKIKLSPTKSPKHL